MFNRTTLRKFIAPRRQARKVRHLLISPNLGAFASLRESQVFPIAWFRIGSENFKYIWLVLTDPLNVLNHLNGSRKDGRRSPMVSIPFFSLRHPVPQPYSSRRRLE